MKLVNHRVIYSVLFYVLVVVLLLVSKPSIMFNEKGMIRPFGVGETKTIFSLGVFVVALSIFSYYTFALIDIFLT